MAKTIVSDIMYADHVSAQTLRLEQSDTINEQYVVASMLTYYLAEFCAPVYG